MSVVWQDIRVGTRALARERGFTAVALLTLALGIGANTAVFSVVYGVLLRPLPFADPGALVHIAEGNPTTGDRGWGLGYPTYVDVQEQSKALAAVAAYQMTSVRVQLGGEPALVEATLVSQRLFEVLGVSPALGRVPDEGEAGRSVVVVSYGFGERVFGSAASALGQTLQVGGTAVEVIGVMPASFAFPSELWLPMGEPDPNYLNRAVHIYSVVGRLAAGVTREEASRDLNAIYARGQEREPGSDPGHRMEVTALRDQMVGDASAALWVLASVVVFVLLIACANIAGLQLARGGARQGEMAVRSALGAGRGVLVRQCLTESLILALAGGAVGLIAARAGIAWFVASMPGGLPRAGEVGMSSPVFAFALAASLLTGLVFGVLPALNTTGSGALASLRGPASRATSGRSRHRARGALVVAEIAVSLVLVAGALLLLRSFLRLRSVDPGFRTEDVLVMRVALPAAKYDEAERVIAFYADLPARLEAVPGVEGVSAASTLPVSGGDSHGQLLIEGRPFEPGTAPGASYRRVLPNYFRTVDIPLIAGREFDARDRGQEPYVVIINESMARRFWPDGDAIGKRIKVGPPENEPWLTIVGVVGDVRNEGLEAYDPYATYEPHPQRPWSTMFVVLRARRDAATIAPAARSLLRSLEPDLLIFDVGTMSDRVAASVAERRFNLQLIGFFGAIALALAAIGVYGLTAYTVMERRRELGIRVALGAQPGEVMRLVLRQGALLGGAGAAIGLIAAIGLSRFLRGMVYEVSALDPLTFGAAAVLLPVLAVLAAYIPARRATRVDPTVAMRTE
jgi:predicted permease